MTETVPGRAAQALGLDPSAARGTELTPLDRRIAKVRAMESAFTDAVNRNAGIDASMLMRDAVTALRNVPALADTWEPSFFGALMTAAQLGLRPNVASLGHGWVLPFYSSRNKRHEAQWILGYQGMIELAYRSGLVQSITAHTIYSNEQHAIEFGLHEKLEHVPVLNADRGDPVAHYAIVRMANGGVVWHAMSEQEIEATIGRSQTGARGSGPWASDRGPMSRKTVLRALWRFMPKTPELSLALATDEVVREGMDKDAAVQEPTTVTVTRVDEPSEAEQPQADARTVDADVVDGDVRTKQPRSAKRTAAIRAVQDKHGPRAPDAVTAAIGHPVHLDYVTDDELAKAVDVDLDKWDEAQIDAAAAADGQ